MDKRLFTVLAPLLVAVFINIAGFSLILPLLPFYAKDLGAGGLVVGLLVSSFSVAQLLSAPMWGRFSDKHGRRPALMVGLAASALAYVVFAYADSLWLLLLGPRLLLRYRYDSAAHHHHRHYHQASSQC